MYTYSNVYALISSEYVMNVCMLKATFIAISALPLRSMHVQENRGKIKNGEYRYTCNFGHKIQNKNKLTFNFIVNGGLNYQFTTNYDI